MNQKQLVQMAHKHLIENLPQGILVLDADDRVAGINLSAVQLLGINQSPCIGEKIITLTQDLSGLRDLQQGALEVQVGEKDGVTLAVEVDALTQDGHIVGRLVVIRDSSAQKAAEAEQDRVRERAEALSEITHSIYQKLELDELMELVYQQVNRFIDANFFLIATYDQESDEWESMFLKEPGGQFPRASYKSGEGITGYVIQRCEPLLLNNTKEIDDFLVWSGRRNIAVKPKSLMIVPLVGAHGAVGAMGTQNYDRENYYSRDDFYFFSSIGMQIAAAFENARSFAQMEQLAITDPLTGLYNRRYLFSLAQVELDQSIRYQHPFSAIMLDIDHFKQVNDTFGHAAGDQVLQAVADQSRKSFRKVDTVGRYGGEEMLIILPETNAASALIAAERLRSRISQADIETQTARIQVTVSMGISSLETASTLETLVEQADQALYAAKQAGRNLTKIYLNP